MPEPSPRDSRFQTIGTIIVALITVLGGVIVALINIDHARENARAELLPTIAVLETNVANRSTDGSGLASSYAPRPSNLVKDFDFEQPSQDKFISLGVCNNSIAGSAWHEHCDEASGKLVLEEGGYTGLQSLGLEVEAVPNKEQVYTLRWRLEPPLVASIVSAEVYVPNGSYVYLINLAAWTDGGDEWKVTGLYTANSGWQQVLLDLQQFIDKNGKLASANMITEVHIDIFLLQSPQQAIESKVKIDDILFFYPASKSYITPAP